jgi:hypothetical protein
MRTVRGRAKWRRSQKMRLGEKEASEGKEEEK